jgi:DNA-binding response OmpR family regulator
VTEVTTTESRVRLRVLVYSDNARTRSQIIQALGRRPHVDLPELDYLEVATSPLIIDGAEAGDVDLAILDGEATPVGGMGVAKQLRDEIDRCPPILVLTGRAGDAWLARWSRADAVVPRPIDPIRLVKAALPLLRTRQSAHLAR